MPKVVDPEQRREQVADAVFRVVARDGLHRASLRTVAAEAGLNLGSVRHYFADHRDLVRFAMRTLVDRVSARLRARADALDGAARDEDDRLDALVEMIGELLPLDPARHDEVVVFLEFSAAARRDDGLADLARESVAGTEALLRRVLAPALPPDRDLDTEVDRTSALVDGLALAGTRAVDPLGPRRCRAVLRAHLREGQAAAAPSSGRRW